MIGNTNGLCNTSDRPGRSTPTTPALRRLIINQVRRLHMRGGFRDSLALGEEALKAWRETAGTDE